MLNFSIVGRAMLATRHWFYIFLALVFLLIYFNIVYLIGGGKEADYWIYDTTSELATKFEMAPVFEGSHDVVVIDIDEASLASMASTHGRWPWSRGVLAEFLEYLSLAKPAVVGVDIIFSDPDIKDPDGDAYLNEVLSSIDYAYLAALRLPEKNDHLSSVSLSMLPKLNKTKPVEKQKIAVLLPFLHSALDSGRFGYTNFAYLLEGDGIVRHYPVTINAYGSKLPSLATQLAKHVGAPIPDQDSILLNYVSSEQRITTLSFADTLASLQNEDEEIIKQLADKIIIIGSSAPGLFDIKPTPLSSETPGVMILATAVDNMANDHWFKEINTTIGTVFFVVIVFLGVVVFAQNRSSYILDLIFAGLDVLVLVLAACVLIIFQTYADISFATHFAIAYYIAARLFQSQFKKLLREGSLLIEDTKHSTLDLVVGAYRYLKETDHKRFSTRLRRAVEQASPYVAFSPDVFHKDVGLLAEYGANGGVFYAVVPSGEGELVSAQLNKAIRSVDHGDNSEPVIKLLTSQIDGADAVTMKKEIVNAAPSILSYIQDGIENEF